MTEIKNNTGENLFSRKRFFVCLFLILTLTAITFLPALDGGFTNADDQNYITENNLILKLDSKNIEDIFSKTVLRVYSPLPVLTFAVEYHFFGLNPFIYHLDNLLLYLVVVSLVFIFFLRIGASFTAAALGTIIFAIHPMKVESVAWVTERKDLLYSLFYLLAMISYVRYLSAKEGSWYLGSVVFGFLSIMSKPMALSLPLVFFVLDWFYGRKIDKAAFWDKLPHVFYIVPVIWVTYAFHARIPVKNLTEGALIWIWTLGFYIKKFFAPFVLVPLYQLPKPVSLFHPEYLQALMIVILTLLILFYQRKNRCLVFAALYFFVSIFFLLRYDNSDPNIVADRFMYLPSLGICLLLGVSLGRYLLPLPAEKGWSKVAGTVTSFLIVALLSALSFKSMLQCQIWKDSLTLWNYVLSKYPRQGLAYNNRAVIFYEENRYEEALEDLNKAVEFNPERFEIYNNRGLVFLATRRFDLALTDFSKTIEINPNYEPAFLNRASILYGEYKQLDAALADLNYAVEFNPGNAITYYNRGLIYLLNKNYEQAVFDFTKAIDLKPDYDTAYNNRGLAFYSLKQFERSLEDYNKATRINPSTNAKIYNNRGMFYLDKKNYERALEDFNKALMIDPDSAFAYYQRSRVYHEKRQFKMALEDVLKAKSLGYDVNEKYIQELIK